MFDDDRHPAPEISGAMGPPPRVPPTAVGVLTPPPPPRHSRPDIHARASRTRIVAVAMLGALLVTLGPVVAATADGAMAAVLGSSSVLAGGSVWWRLVRSLRGARVVGGVRHGTDRRLGRRRAA